MKTPKLLKIVNEFLDSDKKKQAEQKDSIKKVLKKLKKKQNHLKENLKKETDEQKIKGLEKELNVIFVQRKKGLKILKEMKSS